MKIAYSLLTALIVLFAMSANCFAADKEVQVTFCNLSLSEDIKRAHANFTVRYLFRIDSEGKPIKIERVGDLDFINDNEMKGCLNGWSFKEFKENTSFLIQVRWIHGEGWQPMKIRSKGFEKIIKPPKRV